MSLTLREEFYSLSSELPVRVHAFNVFYATDEVTEAAVCAAYMPIVAATFEISGAPARRGELPFSPLFVLLVVVK